jgi:molybdate transport repressor ModE-like protein
MTKDLEVRQCRVLLAVKDAGGVSAAARSLGVAQSTISETLLALERLLGAPILMRRPGQGATLTGAAEALIPHARLLVSAAEAALAAVATRGKSAIRLGAVESVSSYLLPRPLRAFRVQWPDVDVRIAIGLCEDLRGRVCRSELDIALTIEGETPRREGGAEGKSSTRLRFIVSPRNALVRDVVTRRKLETQNLVLADHEGAFNTLLNSWLSIAGRSPRLESAGSIDGVKRCVMNSDAVGVLPDYAVSDELSTGSLVALDIEDPVPPVALRLTTLMRPHAGSPLSNLIGQILGTLPGVVRTPC